VSVATKPEGNAVENSYGRSERQVVVLFEAGDVADEVAVAAQGTSELSGASEGDSSASAHRVVVIGLRVEEGVFDAQRAIEGGEDREGGVDDDELGGDIPLCRPGHNGIYVEAVIMRSPVATARASAVDVYRTPRKHP